LGEKNRKGKQEKEIYLLSSDKATLDGTEEQKFRSQIKILLFVNN
jgi:hypothetical protein